MEIVRININTGAKQPLLNIASLNIEILHIEYAVIRSNVKILFTCSGIFLMITFQKCRVWAHCYIDE